MKDIMLKITGRQLSESEEEDQMEFVTEGQMYDREGTRYILYEESEFSGFPRCRTSLKLKGETVKMKRLSPQGYGSEMIFEKGKRFYSKYRTPYGDIDMEVLTDTVVSNLSEEGFGDIDIEYQINLGGMAEARNRLHIEVTP